MDSFDVYLTIKHIKLTTTEAAGKNVYSYPEILNKNSLRKTYEGFLFSKIPDLQSWTKHLWTVLLFSTIILHHN